MTNLNYYIIKSKNEIIKKMINDLEKECETVDKIIHAMSVIIFTLISAFAMSV